MAASSLSSLYLSSRHHQHACPFPSLTSRPTSARLPPRPQTLAFFSKRSSTHNHKQTPNETSRTQNQDRNLNQTQNQNPNLDQTQKLNSPQTDKKSFAIATGELFLGIASRLIKSRNSRKERGAGSALRDGPDGASVGGYDRKERIGIVIEDEIEPDVIWEQRIKDVEAEQKRRVVTSPGEEDGVRVDADEERRSVARCSGVEASGDDDLFLELLLISVGTVDAEDV